MKNNGRKSDTFLTTYRAILLALLLLGGFFMWVVARGVMGSERGSLARRAATIAAGIDPADIRALSASENDIGVPAYEQLKDAMRRTVRANNDVRFVYIFVKQGDEIIFLVDSEEPESEDYSAPGDVYYEATPLLQSIFVNGQTLVEGPESDRWGTWVSGLAPIFDEEGTIAGVAGLDIDAREYYYSVIIYTVIPFLLTVILLLIALYGQRLRAKQEELFRMRFRFLSVASHELRSPLAGVVWGAENMLAQGDGLNEKQRHTMTLIRDAARYMSETVADILSTARMEKGATKKLLREIVDLAQLMRDVAQTLILNAAKDDITIIFEHEFPEHLPYPADKEKIRRAFSNIIGNALKYSKKGGTINIAYGRDKDGYVFSVSDQGIGIPKEEQEMIFTTYYRAKNAERYSAQGTGMGLYFTKESIELHGGRIWFESDEGKGTIIHIFLPDLKRGDEDSHTHA